MAGTPSSTPCSRWRLPAGCLLAVTCEEALSCLEVQLDTSHSWESSRMACAAWGKYSLPRWATVPLKSAITASYLSCRGAGWRCRARYCRAMANKPAKQGRGGDSGTD